MLTLEEAKKPENIINELEKRRQCPCGWCTEFKCVPEPEMKVCAEGDFVINAAIEAIKQQTSKAVDVKITERGWPGHFIAADSCRFRRNTLIEYKSKRWIVSTVGNYRPHGKVDTIGHERYYETMAFEAELYGEYWDADVSKEIVPEKELEWAICAENEEELLAKYPDVDNIANEMHEQWVKALSVQITKNGEPKEE